MMIPPIILKSIDGNFSVMESAAPTGELLINVVTGNVSSGTKMSGKPTNRELAAPRTIPSTKIPLS
jgi:hypothetical protein